MDLSLNPLRVHLNLFEPVRLPNPPVALTTACALVCNKAADYCGCSGTGN